jgi:hypothetical protein
LLLFLSLMAAPPGVLFSLLRRGQVDGPAWHLSGWPSENQSILVFLVNQIKTRQIYDYK